MDAIREELLLLRSSLVEEEFVWDLPALAVEAWESILADGWEGDGGRLELPDFTLQLAEDVLLHVQYASTSTRGFECSINAATVDREYTASLSAELARLRIEVDADPDSPYPVFSLFTSLCGWTSLNPAPAAPPPPPQTSTAASRRTAAVFELRIKEVMLWSHHLLATGKRKDIVSWGRELELWGISKPGYPGLIFIEGISTDVDEFVYRIKQLNWKALQVRCETLGPILSLPQEIPPASEARAWVLERHAKLAVVLGGKGERVGVREVEGMAEVGDLMRRANLEEVFLTALKITK